MTKQEAQQQIEAFFRQLGNKASFFDEKNFVAVRIGEAFVGFKYDAADALLAAQASIYRFRNEPSDAVLDGIFAEENAANSGGGRIVFDSETRSVYLQKDFLETVDDRIFYEQINQLAAASLQWNNEILQQVAEKVSGQ